MNEVILAELERAVRARTVLINAKKERKEKIDLINQKRQKLLMRATGFAEGSPSMDEINRELDLLDQEEFELHCEFQKTIRSTENEIDRTINGIIERKFGPGWDRSEIV